MVTIRDPIHGDLQLSDTEKKLLDCANMQNLRRIKQLAMAHLVYPGANHTRLEHSLGTMHVAGLLCDSCKISGEEKEKLRISALLHDVGHICFSHEAESVTKKYLGTHEEIGRKRIESGEIADILNVNWEAREIAELSFSDYLGSIITSDIGADRMDYLMRDSHFTGVAYGIIDKERIISKCAFGKENKAGLYFKHGALAAAESLLIARFLMFSTVYMHHTVRIASAMLQKSIQGAIDANEIEPKKFLSLGDEEALSLLSGLEISKELVLRLRERRLYKSAFTADYSRERHSGLKKIEQELISETGADLIIDAPQSFIGGINVKIEDEKGKATTLEKLSPLVRSLEESEKARSKLIICCDKKDVEKVAKAAKRIFG